VFYFVMSALVSSKNTHLRPPANQLGNLLRHWRNIRGKNQLDWLPPLELHRQWPPRNCGSNQCFPRTKPLRTNMPVSQRGGCMRETSRLLFSTSTRHEQPWLNASGSKTSRMTAQEAFTLPPSLGGRAATEQWYWRILSFGVFRWSGRRVSFNIRPSGRLPLKCCRKPCQAIRQSSSPIPWGDDFSAQSQKFEDCTRTETLKHSKWPCWSEDSGLWGIKFLWNEGEVWAC